jgi:maltooligosyltrehalose trehalohydrolase
MSPDPVVSVIRQQAQEQTIQERKAHEPTFGAIPTPQGVRFRVWAPDARAVQLQLRSGPRGRPLMVDLGRLSDETNDKGVSPWEGVWETTVAEALAGDRYAYAIDGGPPLPDPASRCQPDGVHEWSEIIDPFAFEWTDGAWNGLDPRRAVIYELHVGTFTPAGTFEGAAARLPYLADLGVTAIELMPLADFAGRRNWGYDGAALFAPARAYGRPDDLRRFVDAAHHAGLAVLIDVVYNHLGPDGAYLPAFSSRFLTAKHATPWGGAVNLDDAGGATVRRLLTENALHWIHEYHADGLRLDATHSLIDGSERHFVADLAAEIHAATNPRPLVYAEDDRNLSRMLEERARGGWDLDGVWADDFHHVIRRMLAGDTHGYYVDYRGDAAELAAILRQGWLFTGQYSPYHDAPRGTDPSTVPMRKAVVCIQNHDQVGNRAMGDRLHHSADPAAWRAAVTVLLTSPMTPLLFMGQEWSATTPFRFFTDFPAPLGRQIVEGRRREFATFPEFAAPGGTDRIPDPQAESTFEASRLRWDELPAPGHARVLALHRSLLRLRAEHAALQGSDATEGAAEAADDSTIVVRREAPSSHPVIVVARLRGGGSIGIDALRTGKWRLLLDTEDAAFAPDSRAPGIDADAGLIHFQRPGAVIFAGVR